ncbi:MAG: VanZ family protein [Melioribacteraceae bacterium]
MRLNLLSTRLYKILQKNPNLYVYLPLCIYWIFLFYLTTIPLDAVPQIFSSQDKIEHLIAYLILSFLLTLSLHFQKKSNKISKNYLMFTIILLILYATIDELHQIFVPGRFCDLYDWSADIIGGFTGIFLSNSFIKMNENKSEIQET